MNGRVGFFARVNDTWVGKVRTAAGDTGSTVDIITNAIMETFFTRTSKVERQAIYLRQIQKTKLYEQNKRNGRA